MIVITIVIHPEFNIDPNYHCTAAPHSFSFSSAGKHKHPSVCNIMFDSGGEMVSGPWWREEIHMGQTTPARGPQGESYLFHHARISQSIPPSRLPLTQINSHLWSKEMKEWSEIICQKVTGERREAVWCLFGQMPFLSFACVIHVPWLYVEAKLWTILQPEAWFV